jgi:glycosyltransferase involved in cell wall biosynthesis
MSGEVTTQTENVPLRKLRIAMFGTRGIPHTHGGLETFFLEVAPRLAERGHEVIGYCRRALFKQRPKTYRGVRLIYLPSIETKELGTPVHSLLCTFDVLFRNVDVILVVNVAHAFHCVIPRIFGKKVAINVDGMDWKRGKWGGLGKRYFYWNAKWVGRICTKGVITDATEMRRIYLDEFHTPSACIAYGAYIEKSSNPNIVLQYGLEPNQYYLIASRMVPENNADLIIDAFKRVRTNRLLAIAGGANYKSEFVDRLKQTTDGRVRFLGHIDNVDHVKELHCNAYAYIHGHSMGGTNPALLKALGFGNCVVALRTPFNSEVIQDYGILFDRDAEDLAAKIQGIEDHPEVAAEYRQRAPERIRQAYTWEKITDQYEELLLQLAAGEDPTRVHSSVRDLPGFQSNRGTAALSASDSWPSSTQ